MKADRWWVIVAAVLLVLTASLLRYKTLVTADSLFLENLATDLFVDGGRWRDWKFAAAPAFVPDMLLYFAAFPLLPDAYARIFAVSAAQVLLLSGAALWCARVIHPALSLHAAAALLLTVALTNLAAATSGMWLYFYSTNNHLAVVLLGLPALVAALRFYADGKPAAAAGLVLSIALGMVSTGLFVLTVNGPAFVTLGLFALVAFSRSAPPAMAERRWRLAALLALVVVGAVLAKLLVALLVAHPATDYQVKRTAETAGQALTRWIEASRTIFTPDNAYTFGLAVLLLGALLYLIWRLLRQCRIDDAALRFDLGRAPMVGTAVFLATSLLMTLFGAILSGRFPDPFAYRYFTLPIALAAILAVVQIDRRASARGWNIALLAGAAFVGWGAADTLRTARHVDETHIVRPIADCVTELERSGARLQAGISHYWLGPAMRELMPSKPPMLTTGNDLAPEFWVSTIGPLLHPQRYPRHRYNFAVLNSRADPGVYNYTADTIGKRLPAPSRVHTCPNGFEVWLYDGPELDNAVRAAADGYLRARNLKP